MKRERLVGLLAGALVGMVTLDLGLVALLSGKADMAPLVAVTALGGALAWRIALLRFALAAATAALGLLWLGVVFTPLAGELGRGLERRDTEGAADAVFVAASRIQLDGDLTAPALARLVHGIELIGEGRAPVLLLTELGAPYPAYATAAEELIGHFGIRASVVSAGTGATTRDEAVLVGRLCRQRGWGRLLVVTSPYHSRRACSAVEREGVAVVCSPSMETTFDTENPRSGSDRRRAFAAALHERIGLWVYSRRGWLSEAARNALPLRPPAS